MTTDERSLILLAQAGDGAAFQAITRLYRERVTRLAFNMLGQMEDAQDVCQDAFLRLHQSLGSVDSNRPLGPWVYRIASNLCVDLLRRRKARPQTVDLPPEWEANTPEERDDGSPQEQILKQETQRKVLEAIQLLPPKDRTVVTLRYLDDLPYSDIAQSLGTTEANVMMRMSRARRKLREILKDPCGDGLG
ncbi:MAG TPA: RNA polymerase sigma factor [Armatimonadota bacterium]|jgi:RNA polymerase sigma-70 factor (ECF subfamily)